MVHPHTNQDDAEAIGTLTNAKAAGITLKQAFLTFL